MANGGRLRAFLFRPCFLGVDVFFLFLSFCVIRCGIHVFTWVLVTSRWL